jgi:hypothetical protein
METLQIIKHYIKIQATFFFSIFKLNTMLNKARILVFGNYNKLIKINTKTKEMEFKNFTYYVYSQIFVINFCPIVNLAH